MMAYVCVCVGFSDGVSCNNMGMNAALQMGISLYLALPGVRKLAILRSRYAEVAAT